jgi:hypothetical protein
VAKLVSDAGGISFGAPRRLLSLGTVDKLSYRREHAAHYVLFGAEDPPLCPGVTELSVTRDSVRRFFAVLSCQTTSLFP